MNKLLVMLFATVLLISGVRLQEPIDDDDDVDVEDDVDTVAAVGSTIETVPYESPPSRVQNVYFQEHFDNPEEFSKKWVPSSSKKPDVEDDIAKYDGKWELHSLDRFPLKNDLGLVLMSPARHSAIAARFAKPFRFDRKKPFIVQYVVAFQNNHDCGGAYMKLITEGTLKNLKDFNDKTPYTIMFGPDKCGNHAKMHFIIRHKNPLNGTIVEKHCTQLKHDDTLYNSHQPQLLKLVIKPDNIFSFYINNYLSYEGSLLSEDVFSPPIVPAKEIVDPDDKKPADWDDRPKIADANAVKPDDWDEEAPKMIEDQYAEMPSGWLEDEEPEIPDKNAHKPADWDDEMDGEWEPPRIPNPKCQEAAGCGSWRKPFVENPNYKGKWSPPLMDNPDYKGKWIPRKIPNPDYFNDDNPLGSSPIDAIGFELWSLVNKLYFDDILVTDDEDYAEEWAEKTWLLKKLNLEHQSGNLWKSFLRVTDKYPWLWAVYVVVLGIVVATGAMIFFTFRSSGKQDYDRAARHKKTDQDEEPATMATDEENATEVADNVHRENDDETASSGTEGPSSEELEEEMKELQREESERKEKEPVADKEQQVEECVTVEDELPLLENVDAGSIHRKRKPRKD